MAGNGYLVTWALGHLVSLAMPSAYGYGKASHEDLPMLPEPFQLVVRQIKTDRGMVTDISAAKQLEKTLTMQKFDYLPTLSLTGLYQWTSHLTK